MQVAAGLPFTTSLTAPAGDITVFGGRIETPVDHAIVVMWTAATLDGTLWTLTITAPGVTGDYLLYWMTTDGDPPSYYEPIPITVVPAVVVSGTADFPDADPTAVRPTVDDVAAHERIRTTDRGGNLIGTFNDQTTPTATVVGGYIDDAVDEVLVQVPERFDPRHNQQLRRAVALRAALIVESSDYPESNEPDVARKERLLTTLIQSINDRIAYDYNEAYALDAAAGPSLY